jgi:hypothetical protein
MKRGCLRAAPLEIVMPKFVKAFRGVVDGEIYPRDFEEGEDCPEELMAAALELEAVEGGLDKPKKGAK